MKETGNMTPVKDPRASRSQISENSNPNLSNGSSPLRKPGNSPAIKSAKSKKSAPKSLNQMVSPRNKIRERKFIVAKKNPKTAAASTVTCKCKDKIGDNLKKCPCIAYQTLRASQEEFFRSRSSDEHVQESDELKNCTRAESEEKEKNPINLITENFETTSRSEGMAVESNGTSLNSPSKQDFEEFELSPEIDNLKIKRRRDKLLEEARKSVPDPGSGKVMHLVKAFEKLLSIPVSKDLKEKAEEENEESKKGMKWALPGLQQPKAPETEVSLSSFCPSELFFTSDNFGMDSRVSSSLDSSQGSSSGSRRSRRNSSDSSGTFAGRRRKKKQLKLTNQQPFKLRTEQRGRSKEEEFLKKVQEMFVEEEKVRIPIAQGLPWTTDEPECLLKPPVKESTRPIDLKLHSDVRAVERAEFDHHVAEKLSFIDQYRLERERQQKLAAEEETKRLRKELIPRAQPMPYFDRPFIPQRGGKASPDYLCNTGRTVGSSLKHPTIPKEPKFRVPQQKKIKGMSWNDVNIYTH